MFGSQAKGTGHSRTSPQPASNPAPGGGFHLHGLDGLRAIAVIAVMLFHADLDWARGGYLGVDLFFVLSGFLITGLMANEIDATGRLDRRNFYWRRAKRLLPAAWLLIVGVTAAATLFAADALPRLRGDALASFFYLTNWELLHAKVSYFEATGREPLLKHLWSLAIEEQFYIAWALIVPLGLKFAGRRGMAVLAIALAAASAWWMAVLAARMGYPGQGDPTRLYFGTDTHAFGLLLGAALGFAWWPCRSPRAMSPLPWAIYWICGLLALAALFALFALMGENQERLYPWGLLLADVTAVALIAVAAHPGLGFGRMLDVQPMRWIGERSYGLYLWHWPVFMLTRPGIDLRDFNAYQVLALRVGLTFAIAALSYRLVEMPIRRGALARAWQHWRADPVRFKAGALSAVAATTVIFVASATSWALWQAPDHAEPAADVRAALHLDEPPVEAGTMAASMPPQQPANVVPVAPVVPANPGTPPATTYTGDELTAVGDSVLLGSSWLLGLTLHGTDVHATTGWQAADVLKQLQELRSAGKLRQVVMLHLGTNGYVNEGQLRQILTTLKDVKRVVLVNTHVPRRWMDSNNELIDRVAPDFPNVVVVRWSDLAEGQPDFFVSDGVHLTELGQRAYIANIMRAGDLVPSGTQHPSPASVDPAHAYLAGAGDASTTLVAVTQPAPPDRYWHTMARCQSDTHWDGPGGGLSISAADWSKWGGLELAPSPASATPAQQIELANRMSSLGWNRPDGTIVAPTGFSRWRCAVAVRPPRSNVPGPALSYTPDSVLAQSFHLGERGNVVHDLQTILGLAADGIYSKTTLRAHLAYLKSHGLPENRAPILADGTQVQTATPGPGAP